jgi:bis(5'-nucleosyl)-tetraphosphatase (symmetrical)
MGLYLIGDVQGCDEALERLLAEIGFCASRDRLVMLGDLVNRGPGSLALVRRLKALNEQGAAQCLLGNHDLHALAVAAGVRPAHRNDTLTELLAAPDRSQLLGWLRQQPLALLEDGMLMVHAGVLPSWDATETIALSAELMRANCSKEHQNFLQQMYGNEPAQWSADLTGIARLRVIVNALTRLRFCSAQGVMEFATKEGAGQAPQGFMPWFEVPGRRTQDVTVAFGHWSTLGLVNRPNLIALDTGCVWGGCLSAMRVDGGRRELTQVRCKQAAPFG